MDDQTPEPRSGSRGWGGASPYSPVSEYDGPVAAYGPWRPSPGDLSASASLSPSVVGRSPSLEEDRETMRRRRERKAALNDPLTIWNRLNQKPCDEILPGFLFVAGECNAGYMDVTERKHGFRHFSHVCSLRGKRHVSVFPHTVAALPIAVGDAHNQAPAYAGFLYARGICTHTYIHSMSICTSV